MARTNFPSQDLKQKKSLLNAATTAKTPAAATNKSSDLDSHEEANHFDELKAMTAGQIAHLTKLQQQNHKAQRLDQSEEERQVGISTLVSNRSSHNSNENDKNTISDLSKYTPIELSLMSSLSSMERTEPGRLDVRMYALREELKKFGYEQSPIQQQHL